MDFTHQPSGLVWANTLARQEARKARIITGKTNAQYISEYSDYKQYVDEKLDSSLTQDTRLSRTPQFLKQQNLTISADILNVLIAKPLLIQRIPVWRPTPVAVLSGLMSA